MKLKSEASQIRVMYVKVDEINNQKISTIGDVSYDDYDKYDIPFIPQSYTMGDIRKTIISTQKDFDPERKQLVMVDLESNVDLNQIIHEDDIVFELKEGDRNGIFGYEIDKNYHDIKVTDFLHITSFDDTLKTYPRFVGIDFRAPCRKINLKIFEALRMLLRQTLDKSTTKLYEKYGNSLEESYKQYMQLDETDFRFTIKVQYKETENVMKKLRVVKLERDGFNMTDEARKEAEEGMREQMADYNYYRQEMGISEGANTEEEIGKLMF